MFLTAWSHLRTTLSPQSCALIFVGLSISTEPAEIADYNDNARDTHIHTAYKCPSLDAVLGHMKLEDWVGQTNEFAVLLKLFLTYNSLSPTF